MGHTASHKNERGQSQKTLRKRKEGIKALMDDRGLTEEAATLIYDGGSVVTIFDGDNVETAKIVKRVIPGTENRKGYGGKVETVQITSNGDVYDRDGILIENVSLEFIMRLSSP